MSALHGCTIVSENYLPFARVLARSFLELHPASRFFVLLVGRARPHIDADSEPFELLEVESLPNLPDLRSFLFKYTVLECNTAVKPYFLEHLLEHYQLKKLIYLDPDIRIYQPLEDLSARLDTASLVLTPHLTAPLTDGMFPDELAILRAGTYNLGFIGLRATQTGRDFLRWWQGHTYDQCVVRPERGLFVDQKWIDLVPGLFEGVEILQQPGYNVAYWNLAHRRVSVEPEPTANGEPLYFFHFSGIQPEAMEMVSSHQDRFRFAELGEATQLYEEYRDRLFEEGYRISISWPYAFADFDDGTPIPDVARSLYLSLGPQAHRFSDPFATEGSSYLRYLNEPATATAVGVPYFSRLMQEIYAQQPDLHRELPDPAGADMEAFLGWLARSGQERHRLADVFLEPAGASVSSTAVSATRRRLSSAASDAWTSNTSRRLKQWTKRRLGPERTERLKEKVRPSTPALSLEHTILDRPAIHRPGINLIGYLDAESGMGEGARAMSRAITAAGIPLSLQTLDLNVLSRRQDASIGHVESDFPWDINLVFVNADQAEPVRAHLGSHVFEGRYNIGYWLWELDRFPLALQAAFQRFHEIWTPSRFCLDALSSVAPIPVRRVPLPVEAPISSERSRAHFDLPDGPFVFLFAFDFLSYVERKNPLAVVEAFRAAFPDNEDVLLVLKASHTSFDEAARQRIAAACEAPNIRWIPQEFERPEVDDLIRVCDSYVSLHRSEGFGLSIAEALSLNRPVIATDYSGSTDLIHAGTGLPVGFELVTLERAVGPYEAGSHWAEPDLEEAARHMRWVYENREEAKLLGLRGGQRTRRELSCQAIGAVVRERFERILTTAPGPRVGGPGPG